MMKRVAAAILVLAFSGIAIARADDDCHVPMERWLPREAVQTMAAGRGWTLTRIKIDDGCYAIRGSDETGRAFKAKLDPATLAIVKLRHRDRDDRHGSRHGGNRKTEPGLTGGPASDPLPGTNLPPKAVVE